MGLFDKFKNIFNKNTNVEEKDAEETIVGSEELQSYDEALEKTRKVFTSKLGLLSSKYKKVSEEYFEELEEILIMADIGVNTVINFIDQIKDRVKKEKIESTEDLKEIIVDELFIIYVNNDVIVNKINYSSDGPTVILFVGVNGVGKTTTIGKLANQLKESGKKVMLVAGDTFRAGAVEQIQEWGNRIGCKVVGRDNVDPSSVIYDGLELAKKKIMMLY